MPGWITKALEWGKATRAAWKATALPAHDATVLGKGALGTTIDMFGSYGGRIGIGAVGGGIAGGIMADSNTAGGTARGIASGALLGGAAGALTSGRAWGWAGEQSLRGGGRIANRLVGNPAGAFKAARKAGAGGLGAAWESTKAGAKWNWNKIKSVVGSVAQPSAISAPLRFISQHPNIAGGVAAVGGTYALLTSGAQNPHTPLQYGVSQAQQMAPQDRPPVRERYQTLHNSTSGLVQGLNMGRHS